MALRLIGALALASGSPGVSLLELKTRMLNAYGDKMLRPGLASMSSCVAEPPTDTIQIQYTVTSYADLDQRLQRFTFDGDFDIFWYDPRLVYNATECTGARPITLSKEEVERVWTPDIYSANGAGTKVQMGESMPNGETSSFIFSVRPDTGLVHYSREARVAVSCPMDLAYMPFDTQRCGFGMGVYSYTSAEVRVVWGAPAVIEAFTVSRAYGLVAPPGWKAPTISSNLWEVPLVNRP